MLWVDPCPTRFPSLSDIRRFGARGGRENEAALPWLRVIRPAAIPVEPLPGSGWVNALVWRSALREIRAFGRRKDCLLAVGKPSLLALAVLEQLKGSRSVYDAMDDFPAFYTGFSRWAMRRRERMLVRGVDVVLASSRAVRSRLSGIRNDVRLVHNGLDEKALPRPGRSPATGERMVLGYVGTIAPWFDWEWVTALATARPGYAVRLIGPVFSPAPAGLPGNVEMLPPCSHRTAVSAMREFDVGLIPFRKNEVTASVDPIKYYEYRALGLPVVSTDFGEMVHRSGEEGVFLSRGPEDIAGPLERALLYEADIESVLAFRAYNTWGARFDAANII